MNIKVIHSPNQCSRGAQIIDTVVLHATASDNLDGSVAWFQSSKSRVSAHYVIGKDGQIVKMVDTVREAWHAGHAKLELANGLVVDNLNQRSIGIELVNRNDGKDKYPDEQRIALKALLKVLKNSFMCLKYLVGHHEINHGKSDPRGLDMDSLREWANWQARSK